MISDSRRKRWMTRGLSSQCSRKNLDTWKTDKDPWVNSAIRELSRSSEWLRSLNLLTERS